MHNVSIPWFNTSLKCYIATQWNFLQNSLFTTCFSIVIYLNTEHTVESVQLGRIKLLKAPAGCIQNGTCPGLKCLIYIQWNSASCLIFRANKCNWQYYTSTTNKYQKILLKVKPDLFSFHRIQFMAVEMKFKQFCFWKLRKTIF